MAVKQETYGLPDETLQLIASAPELSFLLPQQSGSARFATPDVRRADLISALRNIPGPANPGFTRYANVANGPALNVKLRNTLGAMSPAKLAMNKYVAPDVVLPGGETELPYVRRDDLVFDDIVEDEVVEDDVVDDEVVDDEIVEDEVVEDEVVDDDVVVDDIVKDDVVVADDDVVVVDTVDGGTGNDTIDGGTSNDTIVDGTGSDTVVVGTDTTVGDTGNDTIVGGTGIDAGTGGTGDGGTNLEESIAAILTARLDGTTGTGDASGGSGSGSGASTAAGSATTGTTEGSGSTTTGTGDSLRDAITAAVDGSGASIDNSAAGLDTSAASNNTFSSALNTDLFAESTKPKVPNVTLEVVNGDISLDDKGSMSQTFDYPELLDDVELQVYNEWLNQQQSVGSGTTGGGKSVFDETWGSLEF